MGLSEYDIGWPLREVCKASPCICERESDEGRDEGRDEYYLCSQKVDSSEHDTVFSLPVDTYAANFSAAN